MRFEPTTAFVVVDVQNDFADPRGSLYVAGGQAVVPVVNDRVRESKEADAPVVYTQDWHPPTTPHFERDGGIWPVHCVMDTWGAEFYPELIVDGPVVRKGSHGEDGYSGFTMRDPVSGAESPTELEGMLREKGATRVVIAGLATDYCVRATALDAMGLGFETVVLSEGIAAVNLEPDDGERALGELRALGVDVL